MPKKGTVYPFGSYCMLILTCGSETVDWAEAGVSR
jgi:hypothetical protein